MPRWGGGGGPSFRPKAHQVPLYQGRYSASLMPYIYGHDLLFLVFIYITHVIRTHVTNFVSKLPVFGCLGRSLSSVMSSPIFSPSNPFVGPKTHLNTFQNMFR